MFTHFIVGQRWITPNEPQLGLGVITDVSGRLVTINFPAVEENRIYAADQLALNRVTYQSGDEIQTVDNEVFTVVGRHENQGLIIYNCCDESGNSHIVPELQINSFVTFTSPTQRLFNGQLDSGNAYKLRVSSIEVMDRLQRSPAKGLIGSRTNLLAHQLYIADNVSKRFAPRVLLADEVGLGKTIEAGLIIRQQLNSGYASRVLIVVPPGLIHQWLVEMHRRFNLKFSLFDRERIESFEEQTDSDNGSADSLAKIEDVNYSENPFETEQLILCSLELLTTNPEYIENIKSAGFDLLVVDEAHHIEWTQDSAEYKCVSSLAKICSGVLLLTATPESIGTESYFAQLSLLDNSRFHDFDQFKKEQTAYLQLSNLVQDLLKLDTQIKQSGFDKQVHSKLFKKLADYFPEISTIQKAPDQQQISDWVDRLIDQHGTSRVLFRNTRSAIGGFVRRIENHYSLPCPPEYKALQGIEMLYPENGMEDTAWLKFDPRVNWLISFLKKIAPSKVLLICKHSQTAVQLEQYLHLSKGIRSSAFHENLSIIERDRSAAYFSDEESGAQVLICSEIGSEGRNFQFASHLVLFDMPLNPDLLEQRIGRLDRIGQTQDIQIHIPFLKDTTQELLFLWYQQGMNQFTQTFSAGHRVFEQNKLMLYELMGNWPDNQGDVNSFIQRTRETTDGLRKELLQGRDKLLEINSCRKSVSEEIIKEINKFENEGSIDSYLDQVFDVFTIDYQEHSEKIKILEPTLNIQNNFFSNPGESRITMTTDRETALRREDIEFFSLEHPLIEEVTDHILNTELGNVNVSSINLKNIKPGSMFLEAYYASECLSPKTLQLQRYLPLSPLRFVLDNKQRDLGHLLTHQKLNQHCKKLDKHIIKSLMPHLKPGIEKSLNVTKTKTHQHLLKLREQAIGYHHRAVTQEIERLTGLQKINKSIRNEEIDFFNQQLESGREYLQRAIYKLQALRIIICV